MKKIVDYGNVWTCENLDLLAPINWQGYKVLTIDNDLKDFKMATDKEKIEFYKKCGDLFENQVVKIIKGRTIPIGELKTIKSFFDFVPNGTYGHNLTHYVVFSDGTKTNIKNVEPYDIGLFNNAIIKKHDKYNYCLSGRI